MFFSLLIKENVQPSDELFGVKSSDPHIESMTNMTNKLTDVIQIKLIQIQRDSDFRTQQF